MSSRFKPIPDEEGTETITQDRRDGFRFLIQASNRSPMRRGLKLEMTTD